MFCIALFYYYLNYAVMMSNDPFRDKIHIIAPHILNEENYDFDFMQLILSFLHCECVHGFRL